MNRSFTDQHADSYQNEIYRRNDLKTQDLVQGDTKKRELLKSTTKIEEIQKKKNLLTEIEPLQLAF